MEAKQTYEAPRLRDLGGIVDLTQLGSSSASGTTFGSMAVVGGSVHPPANPIG